MTEKESKSLYAIIDRYLEYKRKADNVISEIRMMGYPDELKDDLAYWENEKWTWDRIASDLFDFLNNCHIEEDKENGQKE